MDTLFINSEKLGAERNFGTFYGGSEVFTRDQVERIKEVGDSLTSIEASTFGGNEPSTRKGNVAWLPRSSDDHKWIYNN